MSDSFRKYGFLHEPAFFSEDELGAIEPVLRTFHAQWLQENREHYRDGAINSAYITRKGRLTEPERSELFRFIGQSKLMDIARDIIGPEPAFMNTQLFFNPHNEKQKNYWHRDIQYTGLSVEEQKRALVSTNVLHFRVPLADEPGIELIPGSHRDWDRDDEFNVRMEQKGCKNHEALEHGQSVALRRGDLLVFSANMIHRGLYGGDRFAFDIILCDPNPDLLRYADADCLPDPCELKRIECPDVFTSTRDILASATRA